MHSKTPEEILKEAGGSPKLFLSTAELGWEIFLNSSPQRLRMRQQQQTPSGTDLYRVSFCTGKANFS